MGIEKAPSYYIAEIIFPAAFLKQNSKPHPLHSPATCLKRASMQSTQRILLGHQALVAKGAGIPDLLDTVTILKKQFLAGHHEQGTAKGAE